MSLESWKKEYYPVKATAAAQDELTAAKHSLQKWKGLRLEVLNQHELEREESGRSLLPKQRGVECDDFAVDGATCALCRYHSTSRGLNCRSCILAKLRNGYQCDDWDDIDNTPSPYFEFIDKNNPEPMIALLEKAVTTLEERHLKEQQEQEFKPVDSPPEHSSEGTTMNPDPLKPKPFGDPFTEEVWQRTLQYPRVPEEGDIDEEVDDDSFVSGDD